MNTNKILARIAHSALNCKTMSRTSAVMEAVNATKLSFCAVVSEFNQIEAPLWTCKPANDAMFQLPTVSAGIKVIELDVCAEPS